MGFFLTSESSEKDNNKNKNAVSSPDKGVPTSDDEGLIIGIKNAKRTNMIENPKKRIAPVRFMLFRFS
jgi:hypothetical protein